MKQLLFSLVLLLCAGNMYGQTVEKLIKKYKALPHAEYAETTEQIRAGIPMEKNEALDFMLARKVLRKLDGKFESYIKDGLNKSVTC